MKKKVYILLTIDTECDKNKSWEIPQPMSFQNISIQKSILEPMLIKHNVIATYLLSPEVLLDEHSVSILKTFKNASFGTHCHEEFIIPRSSEVVKRTSNIQANLTYELENLKLKNLTNLFKMKMGYDPKSFRSGRFGSSNSTTEILRSLGYRVDSSIVPFKTLYFPSHKIDSWHIGLRPYFVGNTGDRPKLLQVPLTLVNRDFEKLPNFVLKHLETKATTLKRVLGKLGYKSKTEWLRPYRSNLDKMISISEHAINRHFQHDEFAILNIMFHSNELLEGASPYCQTKEEVERFIESLNLLFDYISSKYELCSIALENVYDLYDQA